MCYINFNYLFLTCLNNNDYFLLDKIVEYQASVKKQQCLFLFADKNISDYFVFVLIFCAELSIITMDLLKKQVILFFTTLI